MSETAPTPTSPDEAQERSNPWPKRTIALLVLLLFLLYGASYRVAFYQTAVLTTFGGQPVVKNADGEGAGLHWRIPLVQRVRVYDRRVRVVEDNLEEQQTADKQNVIAHAYLAWRIKDPLQFFRTLRTREQAGGQLKSRLRDARSQLSQFRFDELTNADPSKLKLAEAEAAMLASIQKDVQAKQYGVEVISVGVKRLMLSRAVTEKVFERMRQTRRSLAQRARSEGEAAASDIRARATSDAQRIEAFASRRANAIRAKGDEAAASYVKVFNQDPEFAIFLRELAALKTTLKNNTTFLIDTRTSPFSLFVRESPSKKALDNDRKDGGEDKR